MNRREFIATASAAAAGAALGGAVPVVATHRRIVPLVYGPGIEQMVELLQRMEQFRHFLNERMLSDGLLTSNNPHDGTGLTHLIRSNENA